MPNFASVTGEVFYHLAKQNQSVDDFVSLLYNYRVSSNLAFKGGDKCHIRIM